MKPISPILILLLLVTACGVAATPTPAAVPTSFELVTLPPDSSPTATPFQPLVEGDTSTPLPPANTPTEVAATELPPSVTSAATATPAAFDPNALLPGNWTPPPLYSSPGAPDPFPVLTDNQTVTFLLLGADSQQSPSFRTDTLVVAAIRPASGQVTLISIPRDLWVYIPTHGMDRINTAYEWGNMYHYPGAGQQLIKDTVLYNLGIRIDHVAMLDFDTFRRVVDTLGGIDVPVVCPYTDWHLIDPSYNDQNPNNWSLFTVGPGVVHMDGNLALWYARSRQKSSDFDRGRRSQEVLRALYARALQTDAIGKIPQLYSALSASVTTDLTLPDLLKLAPLSLHLNNADIRSYYIGRQEAQDWTTPGGAQVELPNRPVILAMIQRALSPSAQLPQTAALTIEVRNGTANQGWDALAAQHLNYAGYNTRLAPSDRTDYTGSLLYDLSTTPDPNRDSALLAVLGLPTSALVSAPMQSDVPYVLIVGADYQPCFNPANLAP